MRLLLEVALRLSDSRKAQALLLAENVIEHARVCAQCEEEIGPQRVEPGQQKSHSYCRRHFIQNFGQVPEMAEYIKAQPDDAFPPDLAEHPELADPSGREELLAQKAQVRNYFGRSS